jgi:hypothetical protein
MNCGSEANAPVMPVCAALPVVCNTNHGKATIVSSLPMSDTAVATTSEIAGNARVGGRGSPFAAVMMALYMEPGNGWSMVKMLPSVSLQRTKVPMPGMSILSPINWPPADLTFCIAWSMLSTPTTHE